MEQVKNPTKMYQKLIDCMDKYDMPKGIEGSLRERVIRAVHQENTALRYSVSAGQKVASWTYNIILLVGRSKSHNTNIFGYQDNSTHITIKSTPSEKKKDEKEKKEEDPRAGFLAILGIATLTFGAVYAFSFSTSRLSEIQSTQKEIDALYEKAPKAQVMSRYCNEVKECKDYLLDELEASRKALSQKETYYKAMTLATGLIALGVGALAYDKLYHKSLFAYRIMVTAWLGSAAAFGYGLTRPDESKNLLEFLEEYYRSRKEKKNLQGETRYDKVASINKEMKESDMQTQEGTQLAYKSTYSRYTAYNPFPESPWAMPAPSAPPQD